jgi:hypothetical protein
MKLDGQFIRDLIKMYPNDENLIAVNLGNIVLREINVVSCLDEIKSINLTLTIDLEEKVSDDEISNDELIIEW